MIKQVGKNAYLLINNKENERGKEMEREYIIVASCDPDQITRMVL